MNTDHSGTLTASHMSSWNIILHVLNHPKKIHDLGSVPIKRIFCLSGNCKKRDDPETRYDGMAQPRNGGK